MKRKLPVLLGSLGLVLWIWVGSYFFLRNYRMSTITLGQMPPYSKLVIVPDWLAPVAPVYTPLATVDYWLTGERIEFAHLRIGTAASF